jgi:hypothetical protein
MYSTLPEVLVLVTSTPEHAHWWGLLIGTAEKGQATEISYSNARSLVIFSGVSYCDKRK